VKLIELDPEWKSLSVTISDGGTRNGITRQAGEEIVGMTTPESFAEAQGIWFDCPKCTPEGRGHGVLVWFAGRVPAVMPGGLGVDSDGKQVRWTPTGTGFSDLSLSPSIHIKTGCGWHGHVTSGEITG